ncbi:MAG: circularly permuted type 2 ATP-grasp protein [Tetrasphaera sp.]
MTAEVIAGDDALVTAYRTRLEQPCGVHPPLVDELLGRAGDARTGDGDRDILTEAIGALGLAGLLAARTEARRLVEDDGVTYGTGGAGRPGRSWVIDPLPLIISSGEWAGLEDGLRQRAHLLDLALTDLYGERALLRRRAIPPEVVLAHPGFLPQVDGIRVPGARQLIQVSADLGRGADGSWVVLSDRTHVPSGAGYAMANRRITSRVMAGLHRQTPLARMRGFFDTMRLALTDIAPEAVDLPRVALLSPGADSETAFEVAFLSTLLGFPVVESEDLTTRDGRISIRGPERIEQLDVLLRRVDAAFSDPLDLRGDSRLGATGMVEATRLGTITIANPLGAGVLENPALLAHLPRLARDLLGEELRIPSVPTWWCGEPAALSHVLAHLGDLVIKPFSYGRHPVSAFGWQLDSAQREDLRARITARPWEWVGQEPVPMSTAPVVTATGLEPRRVVLRTFAVAHQGAYHLLPGGLGRVAARAEQHLVSNATGALAKDVWVLARAEAGVERLSVERFTRPLPMRRAAAVAPRVADNLLWIGRYAERAEALARLLRVTDDLVEDHAGRDGTPEAATTTVLLDGLAAITRSRALAVDPVDGLRTLVLDADRPGTLAFAVTRLVAATNQVRDQVSQDIWIVLGRLERAIADIPRDEAQLQPQLARILESLLAVAGIIAESMVRDATWGFLDAGQRLERAVNTLELLRHTVCAERPPLVDGQVGEAVLMAGESILTHRRRTASSSGPAAPAVSAVALLLLDDSNPRSVAYQLDRLAAALRLIEDESLAAEAERLRAELAALDREDACAGDRSGLGAALDRQAADLRALAERIGRRHFARKATQHSLPVAWSVGREER